MRLLRWPVLALVGIFGGMLLGDMTASTRLGGGAEPQSYSRLSANPDALVPQGAIAPDCRDCADSYGAAMRLRARHDNRMSDEFRELGAVDMDVDPPTPVEPDDGYRYGGRFPDPEPIAPRRVAPTADVAYAAVAAPDSDVQPIGEMPLLRPE